MQFVDILIAPFGRSHCSWGFRTADNDWVDEELRPRFWISFVFFLEIAVALCGISGV